MSLCRVYTRPDGSVIVVHPNHSARQGRETDKAFMDRMCGKGAPDLPYHDIDTVNLPPRHEVCGEFGCDLTHNVRGTWRYDPDFRHVYSDLAAENPIADADHALARANVELDKEVPDPVVVAKHQRAARVAAAKTRKYLP